MRRFVLVLAVALAVAGCQVEVQQMKACAEMCGVRGVASVTSDACNCIVPLVPVADGGEAPHTPPWRK